MWGKVSCLRKQHDGKDWASNHQPSDLKSNALTTTSNHSSLINCCFLSNSKSNNVFSATNILIIMGNIRLFMTNGKTSPTNFTVLQSFNLWTIDKAIN